MRGQRAQTGSADLPRGRERRTKSGRQPRGASRRLPTARAREADLTGGVKSLRYGMDRVQAPITSRPCREVSSETGLRFWQTRRLGRRNAATATALVIVRPYVLPWQTRYGPLPRVSTWLMKSSAPFSAHGARRARPEMRRLRASRRKYLFDQAGGKCSPT